MYVKSLRQKNNWSQEQLAQLSGLNIRTIQRAEKGESVGVETLKALASVFNVDINELKSKNHCENRSHEIPVEFEREKLEKAAKAEVQSKKEFYLLSFFLLGVFILFFVPNYNGGENLGALISCAISFALIIGAHGYIVFKPFGEKWEKKKIKQAMDNYEKEDS
ncbi:helix-turn-helix domain-containing protein [Psychrosphaera sp. B3R10]|uniref:helix-turn-helix domain-containing protein n=1 Tax=unclassified Psychrosphaera TaxID=2641570 RepID=UPI001C092974|nr:MULTISPECIES: helix-turn-helix domain-containing protein [unclassified Psychrosphaera]MBU2881131.1 helix-turn-helix domain-containing protein [Psychrosphaera sp. I2R16]MBU2990055.1 helix-turn-helix domain-containing protein [Psychrosphaera sp. B3R10]MDO6721162.1 helix-turn-helix domain-containing protein [Psychrosphaera sp. 1_MG-2023]